MMTTLQTLEMVLKSLESFQNGTNGLYKGEFQEEIDALRQQIALEKMAQNERQLGIQMQPDEPVAWMHNMIEGVAVTHKPLDLERHPERWVALYKDPTPCKTCEALARTVMMDQTGHDTRPQPAAWVGLTDEEIEALASWWPSYEQMPAIKTLVKDVTNSLKEKNT